MDRATRKKEERKDLLKITGAMVGLALVCVFILPPVFRVVGLMEPIQFTQGDILMALVGFFAIMWRFDKLESRVKDVQETVKGLEGGNKR